MKGSGEVTVTGHKNKVTFKTLMAKAFVDDRRLDAMEELFLEFRFNESTDYELNEINGMKLPEDYLEFMHKHNGGEGNVGKKSYMQLKKLEEVMDYNYDYGFFEYFPDCFAFGTDLGGMLFSYHLKDGYYFAIDACSMGEDDIVYQSHSFQELIEKWDEL